jgi:hypothetical protein
MRLERRRRVHRRQTQIEGRSGRDDDALSFRQVHETPLADEGQQLIHRFLGCRRQFSPFRMVVEDAAPDLER